MRRISTIVKTKRGYVWVDTIRMSDNPLRLFVRILDKLGYRNSDAIGSNYETMVFASDRKGEVKNWKELEKRNYLTEKEAWKGHKVILKKWEGANSSKLLD